VATRVAIGGSGTLFIGEDKRLELHVKDTAGASVDATGWGVQFVVNRTDSTAATAVISKTATIEGTYALTNNPQRIVVALSDTELTIPRTAYRYSFKRTDAGNETILARGDFIVEDSTQD
jgi:hypothetical protein